MFYIFYLKKILISNPNLLKNKKKFIKESTAPIYVVNKIQAFKSWNKFAYNLTLIVLV